MVKSMLGGQVSPETRQVLMSGENPMLAKPAANDVNGMAIIDDSASTMAGGRADRQSGKPSRKRIPDGVRGAQIPGFGRPVNLQGTAAGRRTRARRSGVSAPVTVKRWNEDIAYESPSVHEVGRDGAGDDGAEPQRFSVARCSRRICSRARRSKRQGTGKVLIVLFQRGAADALNVVVPHGEKAYYTMRPAIAVPRPVARRRVRRAIDLDGFFGLHPSLAPFKPLWDDGILAPVHAVGSPSNTRSHFDAQDYMESGTPDNKGTRDGWLNRYLAVKGTCDECKLHDGTRRRRRRSSAVAMTPQTPRILEGGAPTSR